MPGLFSDFSASASRNCVSRSFNENGMPGFTGDIYAFAFWNGLLSLSIHQDLSQSNARIEKISLPRSTTDLQSLTLVRSSTRALRR